MRLQQGAALVNLDSELSITQAIENAVMLVSSTAARCKVTASGTLGGSVASDCRSAAFSACAGAGSDEGRQLRC